MKKNSPAAIAVIPEPLKWQVTGGNFELNPATKIIAAESLLDIAHLFTDSVYPALGFRPEILLDSNDDQNTVRLHLDPDLTQLGPEGYRLTAGQEAVDLAAYTPAGIFYGTQTLRQLLPEAIFNATPTQGVKWTLPAIEIEDAPRFTWRGAMLDVGRHFMPKEFILRFIDLLALHKINTFHWHLTEDQGWRIEIKKYPRLTEIGAWRKETLIGHPFDTSKPQKYDGIPHGGYYTQQEIRAVVEYARQRFVTIVPEIEMPGHAQAAIAAYPELGNTDQPLEVFTTWGINNHVCNVEENTIQFMQAVLSEVLELFPGKFIHIGGDEAPTDEWRESALAQKRVKELGLVDETQLQGYFLRRIDDFLIQHGRRLIGWDEILEDGLSQSAAIMSWRCNGSDVVAANAGRDIVAASSQDLYLDYYQLQDTHEQPMAIGGYTPLSKVYNFEPISKDMAIEKRGHVLGVQAQLWSEYTPSTSQVEYMLFPRLCALAEIAWTAPERKDYPGFVRRLDRHRHRLENLKVNFCKKIE